MSPRLCVSAELNEKEFADKLFLSHIYVGVMHEIAGRLYLNRMTNSENKLCPM